MCFAILVDCRFLGLSPVAVTRLEVVGLLCVMDRTHSQLIGAIPETCGVSHHDKDYESLIKQVSRRNIRDNFHQSLHLYVIH